jgi:uncharacterized protein involved in exopolysaccharide biosynthesis
MKKAALILGICFLVLAVLTPLTTVVVTLLRPDSFASSAKILHAANNPLPFAVSVAKMMSRPSLDQVITNLNLRAEWGRKYKQPGDLSAEKCREMLDRMIAIEVPRNAPLVEIKVRSDNPEEAAAIANRLAENYLRATPGANIIQSAEPNSNPVRPNQRRNIMVGLFVGATLLTIGIGLLIASRIAAKEK